MRMKYTAVGMTAADEPSPPMAPRGGRDGAPAAEVHWSRPSLDRQREIVDALAAALERNRGRVACPQSDLPCSRSEARQALFDVADAEAGGALAPDLQEFIETALIELETFVPDEEASLGQSYAESTSKELAWSAEQREQAEQILESIADRQVEAVGGPIGAAAAGTPVAVGAARESLDAVHAVSDMTGAGYLAYLAWAPAAIASWHAFSSHRSNGLLIFLIVGGLLSGFLAFASGPVLSLVRRTTSPDSHVRSLGQGLGLFVAVALPAAVPLLAARFVF